MDECWWEEADFGTYHHTDSEGSRRTRRRVASLFHMALSYMDEIGHVPRIVLDAGCGLGFISAVMSGRYHEARIVGADNFSAASLQFSTAERALENMKLLNLPMQFEFVKADLSVLPFGESSFDTIATSLVYHNLGTSMMRGIRELTRVLSPGGYLLFGDLLFGENQAAMFNTLRLERQFSPEGKYLRHYRLLVLKKLENGHRRA